MHSGHCVKHLQMLQVTIVTYMGVTIEPEIILG